jgi:hypothetical protein
MNEFTVFRHGKSVDLIRLENQKKRGKKREGEKRKGILLWEGYATKHLFLYSIFVKFHRYRGKEHVYYQYVFQNPIPKRETLAKHKPHRPPAQSKNTSKHKYKIH